MKILYNRLMNQFEDSSRQTALPRAWALANCSTIVDKLTGKDITHIFAKRLGEGPAEPLYITRMRPCRRCGTPSANYFYCGDQCTSAVREEEA